MVRLSARIRPTAVTLEHVPKSLSPNSTISSAPKDFAVFGFDEDLQQEGTLLGQFTYDQDGEPIQTFHFQVEDSDVRAEVAYTLAHPFSGQFLSSHPVPGTGGSEQNTTAQGWDRQLSQWPKWTWAQGRGPFRMGSAGEGCLGRVSGCT